MLKNATFTRESTQPHAVCVFGVLGLDKRGLEVWCSAFGVWGFGGFGCSVPRRFGVSVLQVSVFWVSVFSGFVDRGCGNCSIYLFPK